MTDICEYIIKLYFLQNLIDGILMIFLTGFEENDEVSIKEVHLTIYTFSCSRDIGN